MNDEQIKRMIEDTYDNSREDTIRSMVSDFYSRKMLSTVILVWVWGIVFFAGAVYCGYRFLKTDDIRSQIMYAALFVCFYVSIGLMKVFAWQMIHRNSIKREIKRLELRIAELARSVGEKS
jgi:hypothetical protein